MLIRPPKERIDRQEWMRLTQHVMPSQPEVNIGLVGHVDHGKTTLTKALSGHWTDTHSEERKRGISIKLGYADSAFWKDGDGTFLAGEPDMVLKKAPDASLQRVVSFVDSPGHETLMAIMITGTSIMDGAILLIAANEPCPQPQTREHLMALEIAGIDNIVVVQNKVDVVGKERAMASYGEIQTFLEGTIAEDAPVIPISAQHDVNLDVLIEAIQERILTPERDTDVPGVLHVARSFDVNRPGTGHQNLKGGVIGGSIVEGSFSVGQSIVIGPGRRRSNSAWEPIKTVITGVKGGGCDLDTMRAGGLCGLSTPLDPLTTKGDALSGQVVAIEGHLPPVHDTIRLKLELLKTMIDPEGGVSAKVAPLQTNETLMVNVATTTSVGSVKGAKGGYTTLVLRLPICAREGARVALSRRVGSRWRLIGYGIIEG